MNHKFAEHSSFNLSQINKEVLKSWTEQDIFHQSLENRQGHPTFVFFEGPPSANGHPGIHHVLARTIKDTVLRYKTMQGYYVPRKAGWDTHGLPVELSVEKELGIKVGGVTKDGKFSVDCLRCIGACGLAPVMMIGDKVHGRLEPGMIKGILDSYE